MSKETMEEYNQKLAGELQFYKNSNVPTDQADKIFNILDPNLINPENANLILETFLPKGRFDIIDKIPLEKFSKEAVTEAYQNAKQQNDKAAAEYLIFRKDGKNDLSVHLDNDNGKAISIFHKDFKADTDDKHFEKADKLLQDLLKINKSNATKEIKADNVKSAVHETFQNISKFTLTKDQRDNISAELTTSLNEIALLDEAHGKKNFFRRLFDSSDYKTQKTVMINDIKVKIQEQIAKIEVSDSLKINDMQEKLADITSKEEIKARIETTPSASLVQQARKLGIESGGNISISENRAESLADQAKNLRNVMVQGEISPPPTIEQAKAVLASLPSASVDSKILPSPASTPSLGTDAKSLQK